MAKGADCKSAGFAFVGSSPTSPTIRGAGCQGSGVKSAGGGVQVSVVEMVFLTPDTWNLASECGCSSMVEQQPSKLNTRVRFPSPAPSFQ